METLKIELDFENQQQKDSFIKEFEKHFDIKKNKPYRYVIN